MGAEPALSGTRWEAPAGGAARRISGGPAEMGKKLGPREAAHRGAVSTPPPACDTAIASVPIALNSRQNPWSFRVSKLSRVSQRVSGLAIALQLIQHHAFVQPRPGVAGVKLDGLVIACERLLMSPQTAQHRALVEPRIRQARVHFNGRVKACQRLLRAPQAVQQLALVAPGPWQAGSGSTALS